MNELFQLESKPMQVALLLFRLMVLNTVTILCSIPVVTAGTAATAMHTVCLQLIRGEDPSVLKAYFKAFRSHLKGTFLPWLGTAAVAAILVWDWMLIKSGVFQFNMLGTVMLCLVAVGFLLWSMWYYLLQSRYENTARQTAKNAALISIRYFLRSILLLLVGAVPWVILICAGWTVIIVFFFGFSGAGYLQSILYGKIFQQIEEASLSAEAS